MAIVFFICAIAAIFVVLHGLVYQDEIELAFILGIILFLTCIWIANQYNVNLDNQIQIEKDYQP